MELRGLGVGGVGQGEEQIAVLDGQRGVGGGGGRLLDLTQSAV